MPCPMAPLTRSLIRTVTAHDKKGEGTGANVRRPGGEREREVGSVFDKKREGRRKDSHKGGE